MPNVLITGGKGQLGLELAQRFAEKVVVETTTSIDVDEVDVTNRDQVDELFRFLRPDIVVHAAAMTQVDACEENAETAFKVNALGTRWVYEASLSIGAHMCYVSTDYIFDGQANTAYTEWDTPNPASVYGKSKLAGERELGKDALIVRTSWVVGRFGHNMVKTILKLADSPGDLRFVDDQVGSPTVAGDLADKIVQLTLEKRIGVYNVTNSGQTSWYDLARFVLQSAGHDPDRVKAISSSELPSERKAPRPNYSVLAPTALRLSDAGVLPHWQDSIRDLVQYLTTQNGQSG